MYRTGRALLGLAWVAFFFQLLTLNYPKLSGDEAIYLLVTEQWGRVMSGHWPALNPLVGYLGPLNFWFLGSLYGLTAGISNLPPAPWMVRLPVFLLFWGGLLSVAREILRSKAPWASGGIGARERALWFLAVGATMPLTVVYSRVAFSQSVLLGASLLLLAEVLRLHRLGSVRWGWVAIWAALMVDAHPTGYIALGALVLFCPRELWRETRKFPRQAAGCFLFFALSAATTLRNLPFPTEGESKSSFILQVRAMANINSGIQTYDWWFIRDLAPNPLLAIFLLFLIFCIVHQLWQCARSKETGDRQVLWVAVVQITLTLFLMKKAMNGRALFVKGCERYVICLLPGWIALQSDAYRRFGRRYLRTDGARAAGVVLLGVFFLSRPMLLTLNLAGDRDPYAIESEWLSAQCLPDECVAFAEDYWSYWPIRYYTRDGLDLNFSTAEWIPVPNYPAKGKPVRVVGI